MPAAADLGLRAHQALAHGGRCHQKRRADRRRVETQHALQDERRADRRLDRRMRAGEHQGEAAVGDFRRVGCRLFHLFGHQCQVLFAHGRALLPPHRVDRAPPGRRQQPGFGILRHAVLRPVGERGGKRLGKRVFRRRHVAAARGEKGDQLAIAAARRRLGSGARIGYCIFREGQAAMAQSGRTSTVPCAAPGQRAAQARAASRSGTSIMK